MSSDRVPPNRLSPDRRRWVRWLVRLAAWRASDAELGDLLEEYAGGSRSASWFVRQVLSTLHKPRIHVARDERKASMLSNVWTDARYALRTLRRSPGFAAAAIVPIALGIGINTGVFSILNNLALRPLPTPESSALVSVYQDFQGGPRRRVHGARAMFSVPEYRAYRDATRTLSGVMAYSHPRTATLTLADGSGDSGSGSTPPRAPQEIEGVFVTCNYFDVLRVRPALGPGFTQANCDAPDAPPAVIVSHALWTRALGADPGIVHKTIVLNGQDVAVVGVAPEGFDGIDLTKTAFFLPTTQQTLLQRERDFREDANVSWLTLIGRRRGGVDLAHVRAELSVIAGRIDRQQPGRTTTLIVAPAKTVSLPVARQDLFATAVVVLAAFGLVLLIACANVANVLLARAAGRRKEIAVRLAAGARRGRLIQQLLTESLILASIGAVAGSLLAWWSFRVLLTELLAWLPDGMEQSRLVAHPDATVLAFAVGLTVLTALACGLVPALQASKTDVHAVIKEGDMHASGRAGGWLRGALIGSQVAICLVLLIAAGLLLRALHAAQTTDPGFDFRHIAVVSADLRGPAYDDRAVAAFQRQFIDRLAAFPGVEAVARIDRAPLSPGRTQTTFQFPGEDASSAHVVDVNGVSPEYFSLIGIPIVRGRTFSSAEAETAAARAVIVTEATARRYWPGQDPIGRRIVMDLGKGAPPLEVVGVARDAQVSHIAETESSYMYLPARVSDVRRLQLLVRSGADFGAVATSVRSLARELDPGLAVRVTPLEANLIYWRASSRAVASLSGSLGALALLLASVGVYGVVSYVVTRRRREVGIRMALGATTADVQRLILRQILRPVVAGVVIGIAGAASASQVLQSVLFGVSPLDPIAFLGAPLVLLGVAAAATVLPTRRALHADPVRTLRHE